MYSTLLYVNIIESIFVNLNSINLYPMEMYVFQKFTPFKRPISDSSHAIWYVNALQCRTIVVSITNCISIDYVLNGRKVIT